jgi:hypothetical protein
VSFFYTSMAGAVDALALAFVAGLALVFGRARGRIFAAAMLGVFMVHRALLTTDSIPIMMAIGGLADFAAMLVVLLLVPNVWGRVMAFLFALKIAAYVNLMAGHVSFDAMATISTVLVYFQLLLILAAVPHGGFWRRVRPGSIAGPADYRGRDIVAGRVQD